MTSKALLFTASLAEPRLPSAEPLWDGPELAALIAGTQAGRFTAEDFARLCDQKLADPDVRLTEAQALCGAQPDPDPAQSFGELLAALGARLTQVGLCATDRSEADRGLPESAAFEVAA